MSLDEIADTLAGPTATRRWRQVVEDRIEALRIQIDRMGATRRQTRLIVIATSDRGR